MDTMGTLFPFGGAPTITKLSYANVKWSEVYLIFFALGITPQRRLLETWFYEATESPVMY